ncbi:MAG: D-lactate dehydrogenase [Rhodanobacter sp.]|nr:MAG: D-lactate dehydrogenase [Rhodanobacter sp.]
MHVNDSGALPRQLPPRGSAEALPEVLRQIVGRRQVLIGERRTRRYRRGFRQGAGRALAVVRPGTLVELWRVLRACVEADTIVIMQAANTGLTGGSTPDGNDYDRPVAIISTLRLAGVQLIDEGRQVVCLPGSTLDRLEQRLKPLGREPHSVIGSSCLGASVLGGVCNNSGGSLVQRGPAYTEMALYARLDERGELRLVNHLGIRLGDDPEQILDRLERGDYTEADIEHDAGRGSDHDYAAHVRNIDADTPARYNADVRCLHEASGCAGRLIVFAVRLDTFCADNRTQVFYIGSNDPAELAALRRTILTGASVLPVAAEYMHRDAFDIAEAYGKDMFLAIERLGTERLPRLFAVKARVDAFVERYRWLPTHLSDRLMQAAGKLFPNHLPPRMKLWRGRFEHHLLLKVAEPAIAETASLLESFFASTEGDYFVCEPAEGKKAFLHRFVTAGAAIRYRALHPRQVEDIVALDIALRRNDTDWFERLPAELKQALEKKLYYGHFLCHVLHQDYIVRKGHDCEWIKQRMLALLDERGAQYPAEHNVGHLYAAVPVLQRFYRELDPCNTFNPGIGKTSKWRFWAGSGKACAEALPVTAVERPEATRPG